MTLLRFRQARQILPALVVGVLACAPPASAQTYDLLLKGGHVIDPANEIDEVMDVAVSGHVIAKVAADIPSSQAKKTIDVSGHYSSSTA